MTRTLRIVALVAVFLIVAAPFVALAAGAYSATYTVTNNSTTASYSMLAVIGTANNTYLAANGFINSTANDTRVQTLGGLEKPWMIADTRTLTAIPVAASSQTNLYFTTGNTPASAMNIITGYGGYITTTANATLEPSSNFSIEFPGWFNGGTLWSKASSIVATHDNTTANVTVTITGAVGYTATLTVNGNGFYQNITSVSGAGTHWQAVQASDAAYVYVTGAMGAYLEDTYTQTGSAGIPAYAIIDSVAVHATALQTNPTGGVKVLARLGGADTVGPIHSPLAVGYTDYSDALARPGGGSWAVTDLAGLEIGASIIQINAPEETRVNYVYAVVTYHMPDRSVTVTGVSPGYQSTANATADGTNLSLTVGSTTSTVTLYNAAPTGSNWVWGTGGTSIPYWDRIKLYVGGNLRLWYEPNTIVDGTTMPDRTTPAEDGVITWGANPTGATGVTVTIGSLTSSGQPSVGSTTTTTTVDILPVDSPSDLPVVDSTWLTTTMKNSPIRPLIQIPVNITAGFGSPLTEWMSWQFAALTAVLAVAICTAIAVRNHLLISGFATAASIVGLVAYTIWPWWALLFAAAAILGGVIAERSPSL